LGETLQHSKGDAITAACRIAVTAFEHPIELRLGGWRSKFWDWLIEFKERLPLMTKGR
jgi:hypothetical protein